MKYRNKIEDRKRCVSEPGSMLTYRYGSRLDKYGNRVIEKKAPINRYAEIQSYADETNINTILTKYVNGDKTVLSEKAAQFMDITQIPDNMSDLFNLTVQAKDAFAHLPVDVKNVFGNNVYSFVANMGTKEWNEIMNVSEEDIRMQKIKAMNENRKLNDQLVTAIRKENIPDNKPIENPAVDVPVENTTKGLNQI